MALSWKAITETEGIAKSEQGYFYFIVDSGSYATLYRIELTPSEEKASIITVRQTDGDDPVASARQAANIMEGL